MGVGHGRAFGSGCGARVAQGYQIAHAASEFAEEIFVGLQVALVGGL